MRKLLFAAGLLFFGLSTTFAQEAKQTSSQSTSRLDPKRMAAMRANQLEKQLSLTPEQKIKVEEALSQIMSDNTDRQVAEKQAEVRIRAILTPDQAKKYDDMIAKREEMRKERMQKTEAK